MFRHEFVGRLHSLIRQKAFVSKQNILLEFKFVYRFINIILILFHNLKCRFLLSINNDANLL